MRQRIISVDFIRIIAAIEVVAIHVTDVLIAYKNYFGGLSWWYATFINGLSRMSVPLFIIVSGYLLLDEYHKESDRTFLKKRLRRVGIPLLIWSVFYFFGIHIGIDLPYHPDLS